MIQKIEHIGIAVKDAEKSEAIFNALLNQTPYKREVVESEMVQTMVPTKLNCYRVFRKKVPSQNSLKKKGKVYTILLLP
jgi:methylmalonyl-CoA/ethylmalonyl-CoA epimerase